MTGAALDPEPCLPVASDQPRPDSRRTILVVDDQPAVRAVVAETLRAEGYSVLEAADGVEALRVLDERPGEIDLVITDVVMPRLDGPRLVERLYRRHPEMRVLFVSGYAYQDGVRARPEVARIPLLGKPFTPGSLVRKVREVLATALPS